MESGRASLPTHIGRFRVESLLGAGGMGEVYKAVDPTLRRTVAIKTVRRDITRPEHLERLYREAQACARLRHPNIVTVYEASEQDGTVYIAMEYLQGEDLAAALRRGALSLEQRIDVLVHVLDALHHAHNEHVIHRDVKPGNVYREPDGAIKLVDFGLARMVVDETISTTAAIVGTPSYASPEQLRAEGTVDFRTDIYSTGALAYELVSGRRPFDTDNGSVATVILKVISEPLPPMNSAWSRRFPELEGIVGRAMAKSPDDRYQSANEMRDALTAFLTANRDAIRAVDASASDMTTAGTSTFAAPPAPEQSSSKKMWWWSGAAAIAIVGAAMMLPRPSASTGNAAGGVTARPVEAAVGSDAAATQTPAPAIPQPKSRDLLPPGSPPVSSPLPAPPEAASAVAAPDASAKALFGDEGTANAANAGLRFRLVQQAPDGGELDVDPSATTFRSGDRVRFVFESNIDGFLYVVQQGSTGQWTVLFPHPEINGGTNAIRRRARYQIPRDDWFRFDAHPGTEQLFVFLSREPYSQLPGFERPVTKTETVTASVVEALQQSIRPRDLVFEKDRGRAAPGRSPGQTTYVVNRNEVGKAVIASITLTHIP